VFVGELKYRSHLREMCFEPIHKVSDEKVKINLQEV
jgi:hypothetical protein